MLGLLLILLAQDDPAAKPPPATEVTPRTKAILARLEEPIAMEFPMEMALDDVLQHIKRAAKEGTERPGHPDLYRSAGLQRAGRTLSPAVTINEKAIPSEGRAHAGPRSHWLTSSRTTC